MNIQSRSALAALVIASVCNVAQATPVSASMNLNAQVNANGNSAADPQSAAWGVSLSTLSVSSTASVPGGGTVSGSGAATWGAGGNSGTVRFGDYGWNVVNGNSANLNGASDWIYTFIADFTGVFSMSYAVTGQGVTFGLQGWDILWSGLGGGLSLTNAFDPTANGVFSDAIVSGQQYTIELRNNANVSASGATFGPGSMNGLFEFSMNGQNVPEPGTLALLGLALAGLGATRRRKA